jgi:hypothetical protein
LKFPSEQEPSGPHSSDELAELQRMVSENEKALGRARKMIDELKQHLEPPRISKPAVRRRKKP